jgi:predicted TIM-barrel fold metal-dependent hydrolase
MTTAAQYTASLIEDIQIIDIDTHLSEPHDLWTKRAPASMKHLVPRVAEHEGRRTWLIGENMPLSGIGETPLSVIKKDGSKSRSLEFSDWKIDDVHPASYDGPARLKVMDETNIYAQIVYPNVLGFGGQNGWAADENLRFAAIEIFNDAMAEMQNESGNRIFPMALLPWWDLKRAVAEIKRAYAMGLRGVNINSDPQNHGLPDLADPSWDPMWETCAGLNMPINFHIGASESSEAWYGSSFWPSLPDALRFAMGSSMLFFSNARVMANIILSGILDRHPTIKFVSVESGLGWVPFLLETLEYQLAENAGGMHFSLTPFEYFQRNIWASFWFERRFLGDTVRQLGADKVMFETDFPHPTCLYPAPLEQAAHGLAQLDIETRRKVLSENAAALYSIPLI